MTFFELCGRMYPKGWSAGHIAALGRAGALTGEQVAQLLEQQGEPAEKAARDE